MRTDISLLLVCALFTPSTLVAQSTAFSYQGWLTTGGSPANGLYEMHFALHDAVTNGNVVGAPLTVAPLPVTNGMFTATLDFGAGAFMGADRWLEVSVTVFGSDQPVVNLVPRQPLTPSPYALHASNASGLMSFASAPVDIKANGQRALRIEPTGNSPNIIGGYRDNLADPGVVGATIAGGGGRRCDYDEPVVSCTTLINKVAGDFGSIGGGLGNRTDGYASTIGGGLENNSAQNAAFSFIGGGYGNAILEHGENSAIAGGYFNLINGGFGFIGGGFVNRIEDFSWWSVLGGGRENVIEAGSAFATITGGGDNLIRPNSGRSTIGGGTENLIGAETLSATISGGRQNSVGSDSSYATIGGGEGHKIASEAWNATISGGEINSIETQTDDATIGGGAYNAIGESADTATIGGGQNNSIFGTGSTIGGGIGNGIAIRASQSFIGGGSDNQIATGAFQSTLGGGGENEIQNGAFYSTIGGGLENIIRPGAISSTIPGGFHNQIGTNATNGTIGGGGFNVILAGNINATIGGGGFNRASGIGATVAGGGGFYFDGKSAGNTAGARWSTVGGGALNAALGTNSTVGGGGYNVARGESATIPGGYGNNADGAYSLAAGENAFADHAGTFVWADASFVALHSTTVNQFSARASGGVRFYTDTNATTGAQLAPGSGTWSSLSDRNAKENFTAAKTREILDKVTALPMTSWNYKAQGADVRHLGPMAQDFHAAFGLGESDRTITTVDADGVALAAIQGLNAKLEAELKAKDARITELERRLAGIEKLLYGTAAK